MGRFYSDEVEKALLLLYFQPDESKYPEAVRLLERPVERPTGLRSGALNWEVICACLGQTASTGLMVSLLQRCITLWRIPLKS